MLDPWNENCPEDDPPGDHCAFQRFVALKEQNPDLKVILAVGGWNEGSEDYSNVGGVGISVTLRCSAFRLFYYLITVEVNWYMI